MGVGWDLVGVVEQELVLWVQLGQELALWVQLGQEWVLWVQLGLWWVPGVGWLFVVQESEVVVYGFGRLSLRLGLMVEQVQGG